MARDRKWEREHRHPCKDCGTLISYNSKRCNPCAYKARSFPKNHCIDCGKLITPHHIHCNKCATLFKINHGTSGLKHFKKGNEHRFWKGGRLESHGYIVVLAPDHPHAGNYGYVYEHLLIWEQHNGKLPDNMHIHHLNGIKNDNRIENLVAINPSEHHKLHQAQAKRIREFEALFNM